MKKEIEFSAKRSVEVREIFAMLELWKYEKRPDMAILLKKLDEDRLSYLSDGEKDNLRRYFQYLGLMSSKRLTASGRQLISDKIMKVPERGIYKLYYIDDPLLGQSILDYKEVEASDTKEDLESKGRMESFEGFVELDGKEFERQLNDKHERFSLQFVRPDEDTAPSIAKGNEMYFDLKLEARENEKKAIWKLEIDINHRKGELSGETDVDIAKNMDSWFNEFSKSKMAMTMSFEDVKKNIGILKKFEETEKTKAEIDFKQTRDENEWDISIKMPVIPKTRNDAEKWIEHLLKEKIPLGKYLSKTSLERRYTEIMENSTIPDAMPEWYFSLDSFMKNLNKDTYHRIKATEDLFVDYFMATTPPEDWKKRIILVDGSNIAWNHKDKKRGAAPFAENIEIVVNYLREDKGFEKVIAFCDANLKYLVEDRKKYDELVQAGTLTSVPSRTIADYYLIDYAQRYGAYIVTGDKYRDWKKDAEKFGWAKADIETRDFKITGGEVVVYNLEVGL